MREPITVHVQVMHTEGVHVLFAAHYVNRQPLLRPKGVFRERKGQLKAGTKPASMRLQGRPQSSQM